MLYKIGSSTYNSWKTISHRCQKKKKTIEVCSFLTGQSPGVPGKHSFWAFALTWGGSASDGKVCVLCVRGCPWVGKPKCEMRATGERFGVYLQVWVCVLSCIVLLTVFPASKTVLSPYFIMPSSFEGTVRGWTILPSSSDVEVLSASIWDFRVRENGMKWCMPVALRRLRQEDGQFKAIRSYIMTSYPKA